MDYTSLLISEFKDSPILNNLIKIIIDRYDSVGVTSDEIFSEQWRDTANGIQLDRIGEIVDLQRNDLSDDDYRTQIKFKIFINLTCGEPEALISFTQNVCGGRVHLMEFGGSVLISSNGNNISSDLVKSIDSIASGGVRVDGVVSEDSEYPFVFKNDSDGEGFAELEENNEDVGIISELYL